MVRSALVISLVVVVVAVAGWGAGAAVGAGPTELTLRFVSPLRPHAVTTFQLSCRPPRGNVPDPAKACAALAARPSLLTDLPGTQYVCRGGFGSTLTVHGLLDGREFRTSDPGGCGSPERSALEDALGLFPPPPPRPERHLVRGDRRVYTAAQVRRRPIVRCWHGDAPARLGLPLPDYLPRSFTYVAHRAGLTVAANADGSVAVHCHAARYHRTNLVSGQTRSFTPAQMESVAQVIGCTSHGSYLQVGSGARQIIPPLEALYPRRRDHGKASLVVTRGGDGTVTARCT